MTRLHRPMLVLTVAMLVLAVVSAGGMLIDRRELLDAPLWLKPFKFGVSMAIFGATMAWLLPMATRARRTVWWLGTLTATILLVDVGIVAYYAATGTVSHFNTSKAPLDQLLGQVLGYSISLMFAADVVLAVVLTFQRAGGRALGTAIRSGFALTVLGMGLAYLMVFGNRKHETTVDATGRTITVPAGHNVGVPEGGPGLPFVGWSTAGGDLRVPHFVGVHGLQVMLALAVALMIAARRHPRLADEALRARLIAVGAASYAGLVALVTWQALRGQPLLAPDAATLTGLTGLAVLAVATVAGVVGVLRAHRRPEFASMSP